MPPAFNFAPGTEAHIADVAHDLREAADRLSNDAEAAVAQAAAALRHAAEALTAEAPKAARSLAKQAAEEIKDHPLASAAAALTAASALIGLLSAARPHRSR